MINACLYICKYYNYARIISKKGFYEVKFKTKEENHLSNYDV